MQARTAWWIVGLVALVAGLVWAGLLLWPLAASLGDGDADATQAHLDAVFGPAGIAAGALVVVGTILVVAGESRRP